MYLSFLLYPSIRVSALRLSTHPLIHLCIIHGVQLDQPEPDAEIAIGIGQDTLGSVQDAVYSAAAQVSIRL